MPTCRRCYLVTPHPCESDAAEAVCANVLLPDLGALAGAADCPPLPRHLVRGPVAPPPPPLRHVTVPAPPPPTKRNPPPWVAILDAEKVAEVFATLDRASQMRVLATVCGGMLDRKAWESVARLLCEQLGPDSAKTLCARYIFDGGAPPAKPPAPPRPAER